MTGGESGAMILSEVEARLALALASLVACEVERFGMINFKGLRFVLPMMTADEIVGALALLERARLVEVEIGIAVWRG